MRKLSIAIFSVLLSFQLSYSQDCTQPTVTETTGQGTYCLGEEVTLTVTGELNDATEWQWAIGACGEQIIEGANSSSITINVDDTVSYFVRGIGGCVENSAECTEIKVYLDNDPPEVTCPENILVDNDEGICGAIVEYELPVAIDNCDEELLVEQTEGLGSGETFPVGVTIETYLITDQQGNMSSCSFTVTVEDKEAPVITCPADIQIENDPGECGAIVDYEMPTATDNCGVMAISLAEGLGSGSMFPVGTSIEKFVAVDEAGNESICELSITVDDTEPPVITLSKDIKTKWPPNHKHFTVMIDDFIASVTDNCPGVSIEDVVVEEISSDEPKNSTGDGNTEDDIVLEDDCKTVKLMAERQGGGNGRVYMVHIAVVDAHGNIGTETIKAEIQKSNGKKGAAVDDGPVYIVEGCKPEYMEEEIAENSPSEDENVEQAQSENETSSILDEQSIVTYPNPYTNSFSINFLSKANDHISIELYNTAGAKIKRVFKGDVQKDKRYIWSVELDNINEKIVILRINGKKTNSLRKVVRM